MSSQTILSISLVNTLSFQELKSFELRPLNVFIGPNGSGKSNFLEILCLLSSLPRDLAAYIRRSGGANQWHFRSEDSFHASSIQVFMYLDFDVFAEDDYSYYISFSSNGVGAYVTDESLIEISDPTPQGRRLLFDLIDKSADLHVLENPYEDNRNYDREQSVLAQRKDPVRFPALNALYEFFDSIKFYRDWKFGPDNEMRRPARADLPNKSLLEDLSNFGLVLNRLLRDSLTKKTFIEYLQEFYAGAEDIWVDIEANTVQVFLREQSFRTPTPALRLSDGTLRWMMLLTVLLQPSPPPLVCIEEPEIGLHPDMMPTLAKLLKDASTRMQLLVTTHSDLLVDALSETPESIIVCEKENGATTMRRLDGEQLAEWLKKYTLGQLWRSGEIGGNRW